MESDYPMKPIYNIMNNAIDKLSELLPMDYKDYIIMNNSYPHPEFKYMYQHKDETDGRVIYCKTINECKDEIDLIHEENFSFCECG